jgi:hypothetical protein
VDGENFIMKGCTVCLSNVLGLLMGHKVNRICRAYEKYELYKKKLVRITQEKILRWRSSRNCQDNESTGFKGNTV